MTLLIRAVERQTSLTESIRTIIRNDLQDGPWVAGGAARAVFEGTTGRTSGDIDIFLSDPLQEQPIIKRIVAETTVASNTRNKQGTSTFLTKILFHHQMVNAKFQVIPGWIAQTADQLLNSFDFTVCQFATNGRHVVYTELAEQDLRLRLLRLQPKWTGKTRPARLIKYLNQGFTPDGPLLESAFGLDERKIGPNMVFDHVY